MSKLLLVASLLQSAGAALPPQTTPLPAARQTPAVPPSDDIVVTGLRDLDDPKSAVTHQTLGSGRTGIGARASSETADMAMRFADCAVTSQAGNLDRLRRALDGVINGAGQRFWQARFVQQRATCAQDVRVALSGGVSTLSNVTTDTSYYERGALFVTALDKFAGDLKLTKSETADPVVQARFDRREVPLARFRLPVDRSYFEVAVCLVRMEPELSLRLVRTDKGDAIARLEGAIVNRGLVCVGNAKHVYFDPTQFRFYIADAVYRWAVAAKGVDSLIPTG